MLAAASVKFETDEDFNDGDDVHLDAVGIMAGARAVNYEVRSSSGDDSSVQGEEENLFEESG